MLRIRIDILLAAMMAPVIWGCAPRQTPAPLVTGASAGNAYVYPRDANGGIIVQPGDTLYAISRYHQTALDALIEANNLEPPFIIKPGQVIRLPDQPQTSLAASPPKPLTATRLPPPAPQPGKEKPLTVEAAATGSWKRPEAGGAPREKPKPAASPGTGDKPRPAPIAVAHAPDSGGHPARVRILEESASDEDIPPQPRPAPVHRPVIRESGASAKPVKLAAVAAAPATRPSNRNVRFLWPANGPILSDFGPKPNGLHNDGINIAMPPNGPVVAAGDGIVSYAGNGLRGYGNLLLIRHEGGWVTAYAHNSELLVEKGTRVQRGQTIARAGRSGGVPQDQLHFEVREGAKAVDPKPLLVGG